MTSSPTSRTARARSANGAGPGLGASLVPISLALPWGLNVGDMLGHVPLPAKITMQVLPPIDVREMDVDEAYEIIVGRMQASLSALQAERRLPLLG
jgi:hypothetical protein